ncbi:MAG TPA: hypothetical protein VE987_22995, partial [Polyangiaceae bacterium]|nr:hypothetical protein [Polyangiaceae bacterium]
MRFILLTGATLASALWASTSPAQYVVREAPARQAPVPVEISPTLGFAFQNGIAVPGGALDVGGSAAFGVDVDVGDWYGARFELAYMLQNTDLRFVPFVGPIQSLYGLTVHHFQAGGEYDFLPGRVRPMAGVTV